MSDKASHPIHYTTPAQISTWGDAVANKSTLRTANNKLKILRLLCQTARRHGLLNDNPAAKVQVLKVELTTLLRVAWLEWRGMVLAGLYISQRLKDIGALTWANVDMEQNQIRTNAHLLGQRQCASARAYRPTHPLSRNSDAHS